MANAGVSARRAVAVGAVLAAVLTVAGCREDEQGRRLVYEKGVYLGQQDESLTPEARKALDDRALYQKGP